MRERKSERRERETHCLSVSVVRAADDLLCFVVKVRESYKEKAARELGEKRAQKDTLKVYM